MLREANLLVAVTWLAISCVACNVNRGQDSAGPPPLPRPVRPGFELLEVEVPKLRGRVNDDAHMLSEDEAHKLEAKLAAHEKATGQQLVLLTLERLPVPSIDNYGFTVFNRWQLGRACHDDGLLLTIALAEHKLRIDVGFGLEPAIPDARAKEVINEMTPHLRQQHYAQAVDEAFTKLITAATAKPAERVAGCVETR